MGGFDRTGLLGMAVTGRFCLLQTHCFLMWALHSPVVLRLLRLPEDETPDAQLVGSFWMARSIQHFNLTEEVHG